MPAPVFLLFGYNFITNVSHPGLGSLYRYCRPIPLRWYTLTKFVYGGRGYRKEIEIELHKRSVMGYFFFDCGPMLMSKASWLRSRNCGRGEYVQ